MSSIENLSPSALNRRGTFSKAKSFRRAALNLDVQGSSGQPHVFRFLNGEEYSGPELVEAIKPNNINTESEEYKTPLFLGANGTLYNKYYIAIKYIGIDDNNPPAGLSPSLSSSSSSSSSSSASPSLTSPTPNKNNDIGSVNNKSPSSATVNKTLKKNSPKNDLTPYLRFNSTDQIYNSFPDYQAYDDYIDYEQSLIEWKKQVEENLGVVQLPHSIGRTYGRPKLQQERLFRKNSEASNDDSLSYDMERKYTDSDMKDMSSVTDGDIDGLSGTGGEDSVSGSGNVNHNSGNGRERSNSDTSTGSFDGTQLDGSNSPMDGSPSTGSLASIIANGTRSRSNSGAFIDHRIQRSNSLSPKHTLQGRLGESGEPYGKMGRTGSSIFEENTILNKDPWDSQLILTEPMPELFSTFEEYEFAMRNWSNEVISKTSVLPPHPSQFIQLPSKDKSDQTTNQELGESTNKYIDVDGFDVNKSKEEWILRPIVRPIVTEETLIFNRILSNSKLSCGQYLNLFNIKDHLDNPTKTNLWKTLPQEDRLKITEIVDQWYRKKMLVQRQTASSYRGGLWSNHLLMPTIQNGWKESVTKKGNLLPPLTLKAVRRSDINSEADGKRVEYNYPIPELPINFSKLLSPNMNLQYYLVLENQQTNQPGSSGAGGSGIGGSSGGSGSGLSISGGGSNSSINSFTSTTLSNISREDRKQYLKTLQAYESRLQFSFRYDHLNSWSDGRITPTELQEKKMEIESIVTQPGFDLQNGVWSLINNASQYLDKFQECFDMGDIRLFAPTIPIIPAIIPQMLLNTSSSSSSPNSVRPAQPLSPHVSSSMLGSPPTRTGSTGSFSFAGSPAGNKMSPNSSHNNIVMPGTSLDSPRSQSQLAATVERSGSPRSGSHASGNGPSISTNIFLGLISTDSFPILLKFIDYVNNPLSLSKLSTLVILTLSSELKGTMVIESILFSKDLNSLYRMAKAISYFDAVPLDLFPYPSHLNEMLTPSIAKGSTQEVVRLVFVYYYLGIIQERLNFYCNNVGVLGFINTSKKDAAERIGIQFQNDKDFLYKIFRALGRKSIEVSNCFLFVLIQLIKMSESPTVHSLLKKDLLTHVRDLSHSKFAHSQFAAKRIFQILQEDPWKEFLIACYTESIKKLESQHLTDLTTCKEDGSNSLFAELVFQFLTSVLENVSGSPKSLYKFILNDFIFFQLYNLIVRSKKFTQNVELVSRLFASLCKVLSKFNLFKNNESIKSGGKSDSKKSSTDDGNNIPISPTILFEIISFLSNTTNDNNKYSQTIKTNMLISLRHILKVQEIFETIKKEEKLFKFLIPSCRDGKNPEFNRNSWRLFFQMIRYHHGHIEYLEKSKYLIAFIDIITLNAGNVVLTNSLHYLTKLFSLFQYETRKNVIRPVGSNPIDTKYVEKDVKSLVSFYVDRHLFIKFHMIYKKLIDSTDASDSKSNDVDQRLLNVLITLYRVIAVVPSCQKLMKDSLKHSEYKNGIIQVSKWFSPNSIN
ncbi:hypothetical protein DICPUDRAFT_93545 [Dictyostelium purpureum]|uniref:Uncharacterized protein n=1 Tax=Dictyostelium purpureum TaxID=5786 RepID=F0Z8T8_DICPU|nr:uncharacterized protein DICPUDRAFT_93545 [Dictyostelium purpureum]EGC39604.1 hypothetical protein DICPUDRAFT_93545 [Dictyostelium purpureum]|eukprot:XP_003283825.1 hypothetical protein DICPUDRAFT_93545 [Dictyostelium purpureum]